MEQHKYEEQALDEFEKWSAEYDKDGFFQKNLFRPGHDMVLEELDTDGAHEQEEIGVLDVGCGTGQLCCRIHSKFPKVNVTGIDIAPGMIKVASEKTEGKGNIHFEVGRAERLSFDDGQLDYVTCCHSFHHYPQQDAVLKEIQRVLKPGGKLFLLDSYLDSVWGWLLHVGIIGCYEKWQVKHYTSRKMKEFVETFGYAVVKQRKGGDITPMLMTVATRQ